MTKTNEILRDEAIDCIRWQLARLTANAQGLEIFDGRLVEIDGMVRMAARLAKCDIDELKAEVRIMLNEMIAQ